MTGSDQQARPPDAPPSGPEWKPIPGAGYYEASHRGKVRSVDRTVGGKFYRGQEISTRLNNQGYVLVDIRLDDGTRKTCSMHKLILRTHDREPGDGEETLHGTGGPQDNRWPENIRWGTRPENLADQAARRPPPKPPKEPAPCVNYERCGRPAGKGGRRCRPCVIEVGRAGAALLEDGADLEKAADLLDYASPVGLYRLAVKYGGMRVVVDRAAVTASEPGIRHSASTQSWLRRVINRAGASRRNSDGE